MGRFSQSHLRRVELVVTDIVAGYLRLVCDALGITLRQFFDYTNTETGDLAEALANLTPRQKLLLYAFLKSL